jgi:hypothetical protein
MTHWAGSFAVTGIAILVGLSAQGTAASAGPPFLRDLQGCFHVSYRFVEDGAHDYEIKSALEWITLKDVSSAYVVTHYGLTGKAVIEHFTEHWTGLPGGRWRQQVGSSEAPRYTCESDIRFGQMRCVSPGAAKPIRDDKRTDYDVLNRSTTIQVTPAGWVQNEVNDKVTRAGTVVATEVGWIEYRRTADETACEGAKALYPQE